MHPETHRKVQKRITINLIAGRIVGRRQLKADNDGIPTCDRPTPELTREVPWVLFALYVSYISFVLLP
ncbi:hypothetical protein BP00DRAFT_167963 [Aspergillus indologenus CBS 114.80]|uniref:Uncharacterized protein n=1 Tax=Aspergillus indologenus CBS 114.80 TaxID=1450541 RepID=A0A2V5IC76_9EURO|nr:hypothetical protein BP00DRAFT_167963 [Aspergillus indologenus CBS 114.80]